MSRSVSGSPATVKRSSVCATSLKRRYLGDRADLSKVVRKLWAPGAIHLVIRSVRSGLHTYSQLSPPRVRAVNWKRPEINKEMVASLGRSRRIAQPWRLPASSVE